MAQDKFRLTKFQPVRVLEEMSYIPALSRLVDQTRQRGRPVRIKFRQRRFGEELRSRPIHCRDAAGLGLEPVHGPRRSQPGCWGHAASPTLADPCLFLKRHRTQDSPLTGSWPYQSQREDVPNSCGPISVISLN